MNEKLDRRLVEHSKPVVDLKSGGADAGAHTVGDGPSNEREADAGRQIGADKHFHRSRHRSAAEESRGAD